MKFNSRLLACAVAPFVCAAMMASAQDGDIVVMPPSKPAVGKAGSAKPGAAKPAAAEPAAAEPSPANPPAAEEAKPANTNVTGKLKNVRMGLVVTKTVPKVQCNYAYEIKTAETRVKKPIVAFYFIVQSQDGTREFSKGYDRKGSLAEKSEVFQYDIMKTYSEKEPTIFSKDVRAVNAPPFTDIPFLDKRGFMQLVLFRFELWVDGVMLDSYDSKPAALWKQMKIPDDWYKRDSQNTVL